MASVPVLDLTADKVSYGNDDSTPGATATMSGDKPKQEASGVIPGSDIKVMVDPSGRVHMFNAFTGKPIEVNNGGGQMPPGFKMPK